MKRTIQYIIMLAAMAFAAAACQKPFTESWPELRMDRTKLVLSASSTKSPLYIYYDGSWTAEVTLGNWFTLEKTSGEGVTLIHLQYTANSGLSRGGEITVKGDDNTTKVIKVTQSGTVATPQIKMEKMTITCPADPSTKKMAILSNLPLERFKEVPPVLTYSEADTTWVTNVTYLDVVDTLSEEQRLIIPDGKKYYLTFNLSENLSGLDRSVKISVTMKDSESKTYTDTCMVVQTADAGYITLPEKEKAYCDADTRYIQFQTNLPGPFTAEVEYADPAVTGFISNLSVTDNKVKFNVSENTSGVERKAKITVKCETYSSSVEFTQLATSFNFLHYTITSLDEFKMWVTNQSKWTPQDSIKLACDINYSGNSWTPMNFSGTFDGQGHTLDGIKVESSASASIVDTLFGTFCNVVIGSATVLKSTGTALARVAPIAMATDSSKIFGITNNASISVVTGNSSYNRYVGGIVAQCNSDRMSIEDCTNNANITLDAVNATIYLGGILGAQTNNGGTLKNCVNKGRLSSSNTASNARVGGIAGGIGSSTKTTPGTTTVEGCTNQGSIEFNTQTSSDAMVGGVIGMSSSKNLANALAIKGCTNNGSVSIGAKGKGCRIAGIIGDFGSGGSISGCYNDADVSVGAVAYTDQVRISGIVSSNTWLSMSVTDCQCLGSTISSGATTPKLYISGGLSYSTLSDVFDNCTISVTTVNTGTATNKYAKIIGAYSSSISANNCAVSGNNLGTELTSDNFGSHILYSSSKATNCTFLSE